MKNFKTNFALIAFFAFATFSFTFAAPGGADSGDSLSTAQASAITIAKAVTCAEIADREPVGAATSFSKEVGKVGVEGKDYMMRDGDVVFFRFNV